MLPDKCSINHALRNNSDDQLNIDAICASSESLEKYMNGRLKQYEKSLNDERFRPELKRVKTFADEEYEISVDTPKINYEVFYADIDISITKPTTHPKVWVVYVDPHAEVHFFATKDEAEKWAAKIDSDDCPKELIVIQKHNLR